MSETNEAVDLGKLIEGLIGGNKTEDQIFTEIANATGKGILDAVRVYKKHMKDSGRVLSPDQRKEKIKGLVEAALVDVPDTSEGAAAGATVKQVGDIDALRAAIAKDLGISANAANSNVEKVLTALGVTVPAKATAVGEVNQWLIDHPNCTREDFKKWMLETGRKESTTAAYWSTFTFAKKCFTEWSKPA